MKRLGSKILSLFYSPVSDRQTAQPPFNGCLSRSFSKRTRPEYDRDSVSNRIAPERLSLPKFPSDLNQIQI